MSDPELALPGDDLDLPGALSSEVSFADKAMAEFKAMAEETRELRSKNLTDPVRSIVEVLKKAREQLSYR